MKRRLSLLRLSSFMLLAAAPGAAGCGTAAPAGSAGEDPSEAPAAIGVGEMMPDLVVADFQGKGKIRLSKLRGKVVLLDIWASWCAPCKEEMPVLDDLAARLGDRGVEVVAVSIDEQRAEAEAFLRSRERWSLRLAHDPQGNVPEQLKPPKMPTSYIIDRQGVLRHIQAGFQPGDLRRIEARLTRLAARPAGD